jgi:hypothetical protein
MVRVYPLVPAMQASTPGKLAVALLLARPSPPVELDLPSADALHFNW